MMFVLNGIKINFLFLLFLKKYASVTVGETGASSPTGYVRHLAFTSLQFFFLVIPEIGHCCIFINALQTEI